VRAIRESLRANGQYRSLVVRLHDGRYTVLAGNHTLQGAAAEGWDGIRCEVVECDDATARRINLVDNRAAERGTYDDDALLALLTSLDGGLSGTGWTDDELHALVSAAAEPASADDPFEEKPLPEGDAEQGEERKEWGVLVTCTDEEQQTVLLARLDAEGFAVRALIV
jgi:ParB-like chromosome segregation protein Spo0J